MAPRTRPLPSPAVLAPALRTAASQTAVTMAAVLATFGCALGIERAAGLSVGVVIQAVVLTITLARAERRRADTPAGHRRFPVPGRLVMLPAVAVLASEIGTLMLRHPDIGDALFVVGISGGIWVRRFGRAATRAGTLITLPLVALLITPAAAAGGASRWWSALMAVIASFWVVVLHALAERTGLPPVPAPPAAPTPAPRPPAPAPAPARTVPWWRSLWAWPPATSTKMAAQMAVALGAAFAVGRWAFPGHWPWLVVTAYIVAAGNRGRGDVAVKSVSRLVGGAVGTVAATLALSSAPAGSDWTIFAIFVVLAVALALRQAHYTFWAAGVTSMLALLYGYFGMTSTHMLTERLEAIAVGSALAVAAAWLVTPIRTRDATRSRVARALAPLTDTLLTIARADTAALPARGDAFLAAADDAALLRETLAVRRLVWTYPPWRRPGPYLADATDAVERCRGPVEALAAAAREAPAELTATAARRRAGALARELGGVRRAIAGRPEPAAETPAQRVEPPAAAAAAGAQPAPPASRVDTALAEIAAAVAVLRAVFPPSPAAPEAPSQPAAVTPSATRAQAAAGQEAAP